MIQNIGDINGEVARRCSDLGLQYHCGADGSFGATVAVIAEAPGERERQLKSPLIGSSGKLFWDMVRSTGVNRRNCYITNVVKRQLRQANDEKVEITGEEVGQYAAIMQWELQQLPNLQYIIVLGNYALEAVTGYTGILNHRGSVYSIQLQSISQGTKRSVQTIIMLNPAAVMREPKWEIMYKHDINRLDQVLKGKFTEHEINTHINPSPKEAIQWIDKMQDEKKPVSLDIESIANETACIGFANDAHTAMCINFRDSTSNRYSVEEEIKIRLRVQALADDNTTRWVMQNGMFDSYWLECKDRIRLGPSFFDTMLAHHTLYPTLPHNLGFITSQYTNHPFYKDEGKQWREGGKIDDFWRYNGKDCCITFAAYEKMYKELTDQKLLEFFNTHVMRLQPHLIRMTVGGLLCDVGLKDRIRQELTEEVARLKADFHSKVQRCLPEPDELYKPNPSSPKQMRDLFFSKLRLVGRGVATDVKNRVRMKSHPRTTDEQRDMLNALDRYATEKKFLGTYAEMTIDSDDRVRCEYKQTGVQSAPGRLSSSSVMWGSGTNLQNQPGRAQKMYLADPGYELSYFDLSQAEAQVVALRAVIPSWMQDYALAKTTGLDTHRSLASTMFKVPYDDVPKKDWEADEVTPTIRYKAKRCRHGLNYTMGGGELAEQIGAELSEGERLHRIYHQTNPEIERWWNWTYEQVRKNRVLFNAYGRRWITLERIDPSILGNIVAFYPQSTIGDKVSRCIYLCESDPEWPEDARMLLNIHDALIAIHRPHDGATVRRIMRKYAEEPISILGMDGVTRSLIIPCELAVSKPGPDGLHRWSTLEKIKEMA